MSFWSALAVAIVVASQGSDSKRRKSVPLWIDCVVWLRWLLTLMVLVALAPWMGMSTPGGLGALSLGFALVFVLLRPTLLLERVFIPRGMVRAASWWTRITMPKPVHHDPAGGWTFYAVRALLRCPTRDDATTAFVAGLLAAPRKKQRTGLLIAAEGFFAIAQGSVVHGRILLASLDAFDETVLPTVARDIAVNWLVADALAAGDIPRALRHQKNARSLSWPRLVALEINRARGARMSWWWRLHRGLLWALTPARRATWRFFARWRERSMTVPMETDDALRDALAVHRLLHLASPRMEGYCTVLAEACGRWERALASTALRARVERRSLALHIEDDASVLLDRFAAEVEGDLVACASEMDDSLRQLDCTALGERVRGTVWEADLGELEALFDTFRAQTHGVFPTVTEAWALFARLRDRVDATLRRHGDDARDALATRIFHALTNWTCRLYNERQERVLGRAVFRWIHTFVDKLPASDQRVAIDNARVVGE